MGRNNYNQQVRRNSYFLLAKEMLLTYRFNIFKQASQDRSEKDCCGCKKFSWMLYILVLLSLALAILNFW